MADKPPAFLWYPKDYLTDLNVLPMSLEEEGAYRRLMDYCWLQGYVPADTERMAPLCRIDGERMALLWPAIAPCFKRHPTRKGALVHPRLEKERRKQTENRARRSAAGKADADARWGSK